MTTPLRPRTYRPAKVTPRLLQSMVRRLVAQFDPEQIILFGSHARGTAGPDSDVDLMVVLTLRGARWRKQKRDKEIEIGVALHDIRVGKDIIVVTPEEIARRREVVGTLEYDAAREGRTLYARA